MVDGRSERVPWHWVGLIAGALVGMADFALFALLGADMRLAGRDVTLPILAAFAATYAGLGYVVGRLALARLCAGDYAAVILEQLSELERTQRRLVEQEKLAAIGRLAAGIAHEVRNPLGVIRASASMLGEACGDDQDARRAVGFICEEIDRLDGLIGSLLNFSKPTELRTRLVGLDQVVAHAVKLAEEELGRRGIELELLSDGDLPRVDADPDLLAQAVLGLTLNAAEAIGRDGCVRVALGREGDGVVVDVIDDGPGVAEEVASQVFEPFFTTKPSGTGLGLAMATRIVEAHGGTLAIHRQAGIGSNGCGACFRISLPTPPPGQARAATMGVP